ncbi:ABC transporter permease [Acidisoma cellulosilytica]|uniref:Autoinducer 2 import system permease protein LsrC n=1 Tax=Acidisoma cellulosilyticum TaxID=2802395 RepID=A0A963Z2J8_9PROT|nr:ABC transporter permease [Acidisoma cellulosilyticum]MCB8881364.1 ABC transporter permease [Acidisoma cellulosilyticum]
MTAKILTHAVSRPPTPRVAWRRINPTIVIFLVLLAAICWISPLYRTAPGLMSLLQRASPVIILSAGQTFVLVTGGFDLSVGSLITLVVVACALITGGDGSLTWIALLAAYGIGLTVGLINGAIVAWGKVPSIITTLGMLLSVKGVAMLWSGGAPEGYLPVNLRYFGRYVWRHVPLIQRLPVAVVVLVGSLAVLVWLFHFTNFGRLLLMIGDNPRAAELSGVPVRRQRMLAFVISALAAVTAGILLGGFSGVSVDVGTGYELEATSAAVIGGVVLLGGEGSMTGAIFGGLTLYALFTLLNLIGFPEPLRVAVQGLILVAAAALTARRSGTRQ